MATAAELLILISAKDAASKVIDGLGKSLGGFGTAGKVASAAVAGFAVAGAGLAAGLAQSIGAAADFQSGMSAVAAVAGATADEMAQLSAKALQLGQDNTLAGIGATDAAAAMRELAAAGVSTQDILEGAARGALLLASAGGIDVARAAEIASNALTGFGLAGSQAGHVADLLAGAANASSADVGDLGESLKFIAPIAHSMGISIEDVVATLAELGSQGIKGSQAGTSLRSILASLADPSKRAAASIKELGLEFFDSQGHMKDFAGISEELKTKMAGLSDQQRAQALATIFGNESLSAATILFGEGADGIKKYLDQINVAGSAAATGAIRNDNLKGSIEQLKSSLETASITLGTAFLPLLKTLTDQAAKAVNAAIPLIATYGPKFAAAIQSGIGRAVASVQAFGLAVLAMVNSLRTGDFSNLFGPLIVAISTAFGSETAGKVTLFVSNLVTGLNLARDAVLTARQAFSGDWISADSIATPVRLIGELFLGLGEAVRTVQGWIAQIPAPVLAAAGAFLALGPALSIIGAILPTLIGALTGLGPIISILTSSLPLLGSVIAALGGPLTIALVAVGALAAAWATDFMGIQTATMPVVSAIGTAITGQLLPALSQVGPYLSTVVVPAFVQGWAAMQVATDSAVTAMQPAIERFTGFLSGQLAPALQGIAAVAGPAFEQMRAAAVGAFEAARPGLEAFVAGVQQLASVVAPIMAQVGAVIIDSLGPAIAAMTDWAQTVIPQFAAAFTNVMSIVGPVVGELASLIGSGLGAIAGFVSAHSEQITSVLTNAWNIISSTIGAVFAVITGLVSAGLQLISGDWQGAWTTIQATTASVWSSIQSVIGSAIAIVGTIVSAAVSEWQSLIAAAWAAIQSAAATAMGNLVSAISGGMANAASAVSNGVAGFPAAVLAIGGAMFSAGASIIGMLASGIDSAIGQAIQKVRDGLSQIANLLPHSEPKDPSSPLRGLGDAGKSIFSMLADGIGQGAPQAIKATQDAAGAIAHSLADTLGRLGTLTDTPSDKSAAGIMRLFAANFAVALDTMKATASAAGDFLTEAQSYKSLILLAVTAIKEAQAALNTVNFGGGGLPSPQAAGQGLGDGITKGIKKSLDIHSPSQVMAAIGRDVVAGLVQGMDAAQQDAAKKAADVASAIADAVSKGVAAFTSLGSFVAPGAGSIAAFGQTVRLAVNDLAVLSAEVGADLVAAASAFAEGAGKAVGIYGGAVGGFTGLAGFVSPASDALYAFGKTLRLALNDLAVLSEQIGAEMAASAATFGEGAAKAVAVYGGGVDAFTKLQTYTGIPAAAIYAFGKDLRAALNDLALVAEQVTLDSATLAGRFAEGAGKAVALIGTGVDGLTKLIGFVAPADAAIYAFGKAMRAFIADFALVAASVGVEAATLAGKFADGAGKAVGIVGAAIGGFAGLSTFVTPGRAAVDGLLATVKYIVARFGEMATTMSTEGTKQLGDFGAATSAVLGGVKAAIDTFIALDKAVVPQTGDLSDLVVAVQGVTRNMATAAAALGSDAIADATAFGTAAQGIFTALKSGLDLFIQIDKPGGWPSTDWLQPLIELMQGVLLRGGKLLSQSQELQAIADQFSANLMQAGATFGAALGLGDLALTGDVSGRGGGGGGGGGGGYTQNIYVTGNTLLGRDTDMAQQLAAIITPAQGRSVGYSMQ